uniref:Variant surface glycoprotein n=1 Tax=Trypanosoma brucei TaxID=5691 RepID=A0A1V0FZ66_9TRYP|nr:variant surface glycoprotein [Trypanosoma brucei]
MNAGRTGKKPLTLCWKKAKSRKNLNTLLDKLNDKQKHAVRLHIFKLAEEASREAKQAEQEHPAGDFLTEDDLHKELNKAIYGEETEPADDFSNCKTFGDSPASDRQANCGSASVAGKTNTAFAAFVCVCAKDNTNGGNEGKACAGSVTLSSTWNPGTNNNPSPATLAELRKLCNIKAETQLTVADLQRRIADVTGLLRYTTQATHLGTFLTTACSGAAARGVCVTYKGIHGHAADPKKAINWLAELDATAKKIHKHEQAV